MTLFRIAILTALSVFALVVSPLGTVQLTPADHAPKGEVLDRQTLIADPPAPEPSGGVLFGAGVLFVCALRVRSK